MATPSSFCPAISISSPRRPSPFLKSRSTFATVISSQLSEEATKGVEFKGRVGFLGLGIMGTPMALNLMKAGCDITVWNRTKSKCDHLINLGAKYESSPAEVASCCNVTLAMLADPESAIDVACGTNGAAKGMGPGKGYVDVSTVDGGTAKLINKHIKDAGASFLEAPVSGSKKPAEDGQLIFLAAGDAPLYETVAPLLDVMGKSRFYLGEVGNGAAMKLIVNMIMGRSRSLLSGHVLNLRRYTPNRNGDITGCY